MTLELVTYNPNYKMVVFTRLSLDVTNSGLLSPYLLVKAVRPDMYSSRLDYFRALLEVVFVLYVVQENVAQLRGLLRLFLTLYWKELEIAALQPPANASCSDRFFFHVQFSYEDHKHYHVAHFLLVVFVYVLKYLLKVLVLLVKTVVDYLSQGMFSLLSFMSVLLSDYLIVLWVRIVILMFVRYDVTGRIVSVGVHYLSQSEIADGALIDVYGELFVLLETYITVAALGALFNFFRIFQFF